MENRLKLRISRIFRSSLASCRSKHISDATEQPFFFPQNPHHHHQLIELFSPKPPPRHLPSICRPKSSQTPEIQNTHLFPRSKVTDPSSILPFPANKNCRNCQPASPISPVNTFHDFNSKPKQRKQRKSRKSRRKRTNSRNQKFDELFSSVAGNYNGWYGSSEDENEGKHYDDETTFFSSKSMSSDSSEYFGRNRAKNMQGKIERKLESDDQKGNLMIPPLEGKVKDSFAVVKRSSDPYNDFRTSMVEMIVERQIFGTKDLENLLQCFLSLNSTCHHKVIIEVYMEIWETLFSDWA